jgi:hypothetical protein
MTDIKISAPFTHGTVRHEAGSVVKNVSDKTLGFLSKNGIGFTVVAKDSAVVIPAEIPVADVQEEKSQGDVPSGVNTYTDVDPGSITSNVKERTFGVKIKK